MRVSRLEDGTCNVVCFNSLKHIESYKYLGIRLSGRPNLSEEVEYRIRKIKAQSDKLLFNALSMKQVANTAKVMLQSISNALNFLQPTCAQA